MLKIRIENLDRLREAFSRVPAKIAPELQRATLEAGKVIRNTEVVEAPHKTGTLQRSIKLNYRPIAVEIYPTVEYAKYLITGTRAHEIYPTRAKALRFVGRDGQIHFAKKVMHTGTQPNNFVGRTVDIATEPVNKIFQGALKNIIDILNG